MHAGQAMAKRIFKAFNNSLSLSALATLATLAATATKATDEKCIHGPQIV